MARWIRLVKAHTTMASSWSTSIVLKYRTGDIGIPGDPRLLPRLSRVSTGFLGAAGLAAQLRVKTAVDGAAPRCAMRRSLGYLRALHRLELLAARAQVSVASENYSASIEHGRLWLWGRPGWLALAGPSSRADGRASRSALGRSPLPGAVLCMGGAPMTKFVLKVSLLCSTPYSFFASQPHAIYIYNVLCLEFIMCYMKYFIFVM